MFRNMCGSLKMKNEIKLPKKYFTNNLHVSQLDRWYLSFLKSYLKRVEKLESTFSIIIQGPINNRSINTIESYLKYGEVIVSCWNTDQISLLDKYKDRIKIVVNNYSDIEGSHSFVPGTQAPWIYQNYTTLKGLLEAKGYFSIKVRSDESYPVLDALVEKMMTIHHKKKNEKTKEYDHHKIVTSNIYFRRDSENKFHPSDHLVAGKTSRMKDVYETAVSYSSKGSGNQRFPEQLFCRSVIESRWIKGKGMDTMRPAESIQQMKDYFDIIRISDLPNHIWTSSYRKYDALYSEEDWCHDINSI